MILSARRVDYKRTSDILVLGDEAERELIVSLGELFCEFEDSGFDFLELGVDFKLLFFLLGILLFFEEIEDVEKIRVFA